MEAAGPFCGIIHGMEEMSEYEKENRRKNLIFGVIMIIVIVILQFLMYVFFGIEPQWGPMPPIHFK